MFPLRKKYIAGGSKNELLRKNMETLAKHGGLIWKAKLKPAHWAARASNLFALQVLNTVPSSELPSDKNHWHTGVNLSKSLEHKT